MKPVTIACSLAFAATLSLASANTFAAPDEIVVFTDEFEKKGEVGYELHLTCATKARSAPDYPGEQPPHRVLRLMPEVVWGLSENWNFGLHVPVSHNRNTGSSTIDGVKARLHYLDVREQGADQAFFYGANYELTYYDKRIDPSRLNAEIRGIVGLRNGNWRYTLNPILSRPLRDNPHGKHVGFELFGQIMRSFGDGRAFGVEHYSGFGPLSDPTFGSGADQITYLVAEFKTKSHFEIHVGIGHGWTNTSDRRVFKALIGLPF